MTDREAVAILERFFNKSCGDYRYQNKQKLDTEDAMYHAITMLQERIDRETGCEKPMTNADRIRAMSDEELAECLCDIRSKESYEPCSDCMARDYCDLGHTGFIDWLRQPAKED